MKIIEQSIIRHPYEGVDLYTLRVRIGGIEYGQALRVQYCYRGLPADAVWRDMSRAIGRHVSEQIDQIRD